jgi:hypothetical protein
MVPEMSAEQHAISPRKAVYLPEFDYVLLYADWITNKELQNTFLFPEFLAAGSTEGHQRRGSYVDDCGRVGQYEEELPVNLSIPAF